MFIRPALHIGSLMDLCGNGDVREAPKIREAEGGRFDIRVKVQIALESLS